MVVAIDDLRRGVETMADTALSMTGANGAPYRVGAASTASGSVAARRAGQLFASALAEAAATPGAAPSAVAVAATATVPTATVPTAVVVGPVTTATTVGPVATATTVGPVTTATTVGPVTTATTVGPVTTAATATPTEADQDESTMTLATAHLAALTTATPQQRNLGDGVVVGALDHLGTPYLWGGNDPDTGIDCSGLVRTAFREIGVDMPRVSRDQARMGVEVTSLEGALPGDLLAFGEPVNHVAIYLGDGKMVHSPRSGEVVKVEDIDRPIATIRRIVDTQRAPGSTWTSLESNQPFGPEDLQPLFEAAGDRWNIDPALLAAVAQVESNFDPSAVSKAGATGLMQFMPATAAALGVDPTDPASSINGAAQYLRQNLDRFGSMSLALAAYNAGPGNVAKYGGIPPFDETQRYVRKVQEIWSANAA